MYNPVVKCGQYKSDGLVPTVNDDGRAVCTNCGQVVISNSYDFDEDSTHIYYSFIGAYCSYHKAIHYRWTRKNWSLLHNPPLREKKKDEQTILAQKSDHDVDKYFHKDLRWVTEPNGCLSPGFREVRHSGIDNSNLVLLRPTDTGYLLVNQQGMHAPFIAAVIEWLLHRNEWPNILELVNNSMLSDRKKRIIGKSITNPTPSNIFKMLWTFNRFIPGWNSKRSLGRRSPSMLIQDEIRWATNRLDDLDKKDKDRLVKYGPEPDLWGTWPELWPKDLELGNTLNQFGPHLDKLGIEYGDTLKLITDPEQKGQRSWLEIASRLTNWPLSMEIGGDITNGKSLRSRRGFIERLTRNVGVAIEPKSTPTESDKWENYLLTNMPLCWLGNLDKDTLEFTLEDIEITGDDLLQTLKTLEPWIQNETNLEVVLHISHSVPNNIKKRIQSMAQRLSDTSVNIEYTAQSILE